eukprot:TRINITY_DN4349_c0_g1_i5.p1 TRINITY_DN4349_c0_g1~~TRINITY_DN4349_c0_g1_i5.p1  ORF type:complete len:2700 (+),score=461.95 TRINITY_DN4349_c0_g1_i5:43-8100(+)
MASRHEAEGAWPELPLSRTTDDRDGGSAGSSVRAVETVWGDAADRAGRPPARAGWRIEDRDGPGPDPPALGRAQSLPLTPPRVSAEAGPPQPAQKRQLWTGAPSDPPPPLPMAGEGAVARSPARSGGGSPKGDRTRPRALEQRGGGESLVPAGRPEPEPARRSEHRPERRTQQTEPEQQPLPRRACGPPRRSHGAPRQHPPWHDQLLQADAVQASGDACPPRPRSGGARRPSERPSPAVADGERTPLGSRATVPAQSAEDAQGAEVETAVSQPSPAAAHSDPALVAAAGTGKRRSQRLSPRHGHPAAGQRQVWTGPPLVAPTPLPLAAPGVAAPPAPRRPAASGGQRRSGRSELFSNGAGYEQTPVSGSGQRRKHPRSPRAGRRQPQVWTGPPAAPPPSCPVADAGDARDVSDARRGGSPSARAGAEGGTEGGHSGLPEPLPTGARFNPLSAAAAGQYRADVAQQGAESDAVDDRSPASHRGAASPEQRRGQSPRSSRPPRQRQVWSSDAVVRGSIEAPPAEGSDERRSERPASTDARSCQAVQRRRGQQPAWTGPPAVPPPPLPVPGDVRSSEPGSAGACRRGAAPVLARSDSELPEPVPAGVPVTGRHGEPHHSPRTGRAPAELQLRPNGDAGQAAQRSVGQDKAAPTVPRHPADDGERRQAASAVAHADAGTEPRRFTGRQAWVGPPAVPPQPLPVGAAQSAAEEPSRRSPAAGRGDAEADGYGLVRPDTPPALPHSPGRRTASDAGRRTAAAAGAHDAGRRTAAAANDGQTAAAAGHAGADADAGRRSADVAAATDAGHRTPDTPGDAGRCAPGQPPPVGPAPLPFSEHRKQPRSPPAAAASDQRRKRQREAWTGPPAVPPPPLPIAGADVQRGPAACEGGDGTCACAGGDATEVPPSEGSDLPSGPGGRSPPASSGAAADRTGFSVPAAGGSLSSPRAQRWPRTGQPGPAADGHRQLHPNSPRSGADAAGEEDVRCGAARRAVAGERLPVATDAPPRSDVQHRSEMTPVPVAQGRTRTTVPDPASAPAEGAATGTSPAVAAPTPARPDERRGVLPSAAAPTQTRLHEGSGLPPPPPLAGPALQRAGQRLTPPVFEEEPAPGCDGSQGGDEAANRRQAGEHAPEPSFAAPAAEPGRPRARVLSPFSPAASCSLSSPLEPPTPVVRPQNAAFDTVSPLSLPPAAQLSACSGSDGDGAAQWLANESLLSPRLADAHRTEPSESVVQPLAEGEAAAWIDGASAAASGTQTAPPPPVGAATEPPVSGLWPQGAEQQPGRAAPEPPQPSDGSERDGEMRGEQPRRVRLRPTPIHSAGQPDPARAVAGQPDPARAVAGQPDPARAVEPAEHPAAAAEAASGAAPAQCSGFPGSEADEAAAAHTPPKRGGSQHTELERMRAAERRTEPDPAPRPRVTARRLEPGPAEFGAVPQRGRWGQPPPPTSRAPERSPASRAAPEQSSPPASRAAQPPVSRTAPEQSSPATGAAQPPPPSRAAPERTFRTAPQLPPPPSSRDAPERPPPASRAAPQQAPPASRAAPRPTAPERLPPSSRAAAPQQPPASRAVPQQPPPASRAAPEQSSPPASHAAQPPLTSRAAPEPTALERLPPASRAAAPQPGGRGAEPQQLPPTSRAAPQQLPPTSRAAPQQSSRPASGAAAQEPTFRTAPQQPPPASRAAPVRQPPLVSAVSEPDATRGRQPSASRSAGGGSSPRAKEDGAAELTAETAAAHKPEMRRSFGAATARQQPAADAARRPVTASGPHAQPAAPMLPTAKQVQPQTVPRAGTALERDAVASELQHLDAGSGGRMGAAPAVSSAVLGSKQTDPWQGTKARQGAAPGAEPAAASRRPAVAGDAPEPPSNRHDQLGAIRMQGSSGGVGTAHPTTAAEAAKPASGTGDGVRRHAEVFDLRSPAPASPGTIAAASSAAGGSYPREGVLPTVRPATSVAGYPPEGAVGHSRLPPPPVMRPLADSARSLPPPPRSWRSLSKSDAASVSQPYRRGVDAVQRSALSSSGSAGRRARGVVFLPTSEVAAAMSEAVWRPDPASAHALVSGCTDASPAALCEYVCRRLDLWCEAAADGAGVEVVGFETAAEFASAVAAALARSSVVPEPRIDCGGIADPFADGGEPTEVYISTASLWVLERDAATAEAAAALWLASAILRDDCGTDPSCAAVVGHLRRGRDGGGRKLARIRRWFRPGSVRLVPAEVSGWFTAVTRAMLSLLRCGYLVPDRAQRFLAALMADGGGGHLTVLAVLRLEEDWRTHLARTVAVCVADGDPELQSQATTAARLVAALTSLLPASTSGLRVAGLNVVRVSAAAIPASMTSGVVAPLVAHLCHSTLRFACETCGSPVPSTASDEEAPVNPLGTGTPPGTPLSPHGSFRRRLRLHDCSPPQSPASHASARRRSLWWPDASPSPPPEPCPADSDVRTASAFSALLALESFVRHGVWDRLLASAACSGDPALESEVESLPQTLLRLLEECTDTSSPAPETSTVECLCSRLLTFAWVHPVSAAAGLVAALVRGLTAPCDWRVVDAVSHCVAHVVARSGGDVSISRAGAGAVEILLYQATAFGRGVGDQRRLRLRCCAGICSLGAVSPVFFRAFVDAVRLSGHNPTAAAVACSSGDHTLLSAALADIWHARTGGADGVAAALHSVITERIGLPSPRPPTPSPRPLQLSCCLPPLPTPR